MNRVAGKREYSDFNFRNYVDILTVSHNYTVTMPKIF